MAKGFLRGMMWGTGVGFVSVVSLSLVDSIADWRPSEDRSQMSVARPGQIAQPDGRTGGSGPSAAGVVAPEVAGPEPDTLAGLLPESFAPAAVPQAGNASSLTSQAAPSEVSGGIDISLDAAPAVATPRIDGLQTPETEPLVSFASEPSQPVAPEVETASSAFASVAAPEPPVTDQTVIETAVQDAAAQEPEKPSPTKVEEAPILGASAPDPVKVRPTEPATVTPDGETATEPTAPIDTQIAALAPEPLSPEAPRVVVDAPQQPSANELIVDAPAPMTAEANAPRPTIVGKELPEPAKSLQETAADDSRTAQVSAVVSVEVQQSVTVDRTELGDVAQPISPAQRAQPFDQLPGPDAREASIAPDVAQLPSPPKAAEPETREAAAPVRVNRLPTLSNEAPEPPVNVVPESDILTETDPGVPPVDRFATPFENPDNLPLMAVVLMDEGADLDAADGGLAALKSLPYPVSIAVPALQPDAASRMERYRAAGFEVLATVDLPQGARATDAEVNIASALDALPQVVGVLDGVKTGVQTTPDAGRQVADILAQSGHGLVTQNRGLNTVQKLAARAGVPSAVVFRDFDSKGQSSAVIRRFMDQAAFRAGQEGAVVMLGRLRAETIGALLLWTLQDRASTVAMAPVTAALQTAEN